MGGTGCRAAYQLRHASGVNESEGGPDVTRAGKSCVPSKLVAVRILLWHVYLLGSARCSMAADTYAALLVNPQGVKESKLIWCPGSGIRFCSPDTGMLLMAVATISLSISMALFDRHAAAIDPVCAVAVGGNRIWPRSGNIPP